MWLVALAFGQPPADFIPCVRDGTQSVERDGVTFLLGPAAFASSVVRFSVGPGVTPPYDRPETVLGLPDFHEGRGAVSLGNADAAAELVVRFDHVTLFDVPGPDLYVFEAGPLVEATRVSVSDDGIVWVDIGRIEGSTRAVDLDGRLPPSGRVQYVRLVSDVTGSRSPYAGPDVDAIGAIGACPVRRGTGLLR